MARKCCSCILVSAAREGRSFASTITVLCHRSDGVMLCSVSSGCFPTLDSRARSATWRSSVCSFTSSSSRRVAHIVGSGVTISFSHDVHRSHHLSVSERSPRRDRGAVSRIRANSGRAILWYRHRTWYRTGPVPAPVPVPVPVRSRHVGTRLVS